MEADSSSALNTQLELGDVVHDSGRNKATIYAAASGDTPFGDFKNAYAFFIEFDDRGEEIKRLDEFMDSLFLIKFFPGFKQYLAGEISKS